MNNTTNLSAPTSPAGNTVEAATNSLSTATNNNSSNKSIDQRNSEDCQLPAELARSRSLSLSNSPGEAPVDKQQDQQNTASASALESLKVKIKTNSITNTIFATTTATAPTIATTKTSNDSNNNNNNNLSSSNNNGSNDSKLANENLTTSSKGAASPLSTPKSTTNSRSGGRKSKQNSDTSSASSNSTSTSNNSSFSSTDTSSPASSGASSATKMYPDMNVHGNPSPAENGKKTTLASGALPPPPPPSQLPSSNLTPQIPPVLPTQHQSPLPTQSQQPPLPSSMPQPPPISTQPPQTVAPTKPPSAAPTPSQTTPKPKTTRAKKQTAANNKDANATNAITKPEAKTRTKKAKQTTETKASAAAAAAATTLASSLHLQPISSATTTTASTDASSSASASDKKGTENQLKPPSTTPAKKRKPRAPPATDPNAQPTNPPKRTRKKKADQAATANEAYSNPPPPSMSSNMTLPPLSVNPQLLSVASSIPMGASPLMSNAPQQQYQTMQPLNRNMPGMSPLDVHAHNQRYAPATMELSPYQNHDYLNTNSLTRQHSLSKLLFTSSSSTSAIQTNPHSDEIAKAFEELRDHSWSHLSRCILEPAQQFDLPALIGTLYELRADNERQLKRVKDLTLQREQLAAMNAKLDLSGPMLLQNLNQTSPGFASVVAGLQNSPKSLPNSSPSPAMNKSPIVPGGAYNHVPPGSSLGPPGILYDRNSPMVGLQTQHSSVNSLKSSMISTPSPPTSAFMAHGANNRAGLMTVNNPPYMTNVHPSISALNSLGGPAPPSYYPRQ